MTVHDGSQFDYIIVGGGSAGCVLANRLSGNAALRVLLIEAGPDLGFEAEPARLTDRGVRSISPGEYFWSGLTVLDGPRPKPILQAKVLGGGSMINGMHAQRGASDDFDEWRQYGVEGWSWSDVLPYFVRLEHDVDFAGPLHGASGPIEVRRVAEAHWSPLTIAFREALERRGLPRVEDINTEDGDCTAPAPLNNTAAKRISAASAYLAADVRARKNLEILSGAIVEKIIFDGKTASGVQLAGGRVIRGGNTIVSAGAIHSPVILLRSGIGPADQLADARIPLIAERSGVGQNLRSHPILTITAHLKRQGRQLDPSVRPPVTMVTRYSSKLPGCQPTDMLFNVYERTPGLLLNDPMSRQLASLMVILNKSYSQGEVRITPATASAAFEVRARLLSDPRDHDRMVQGFLMVREMLHEAPVGPLINHAFLANLVLGRPIDRLTAKMLRDTNEARLISTAGAAAMDLLPWMRTRTMAKAGLDIDSVGADRDQLSSVIANATSFGGHPGGTCRLGRADQPDAVLDFRCRVIGVEGLRVVDASIFPTLMRAGTNIPVIMAAEKAADMILEDRRKTPPLYTDRSVSTVS